MKRTTQKRRRATWPLSVSLAALLIASCGMRGQRPEPANARQRASLRENPLSSPAANEPQALSWGRFFLSQASPAVGLMMADFTGDTHPDLATVELDRVDAEDAHYWIEIRLTEGGSQTLGLTAPAGGLFIAAKDVTGDGNLDLVVRSAKSRALVGIFLNDGDGRFNRVNTANFSRLIGDTTCGFSFTTRSTFLGAMLGCPESHEIARPKRSPHPLPVQTGVLLRLERHAISQSFLSFSLNRAPPSSSLA